MRSHVVMLNNNFTHINKVIIKAIKNESHVIQFLLSYSSDFNPIELTFSVLKIWLQHHYVWTHSFFKRFENYLQ